MNEPQNDTEVTKQIMNTTQRSARPATIAMVFILFATLLTGCAARHAGPAAVPEPAGTPRLHLSETEFNFNRAMEGEAVTHEFIIENRGGALLAVTSVRPERGCTAEAIPAQIPAGEKGVIRVTLHMPRRGGKFLLKKVWFHTNDPSRPRGILAVSGKVERYVRMPPMGAMLYGRVGETIAHEIRITPHPDHPFTVTASKAQRNMEIRYEMKPAGDPVSRKGYLLKVISTRTTPGSISDVIELSTDSEKVPRILVFVRGRVDPAEPAANPKNE